MAVNSTCLSGSNCSGVQFFKCMDSYPGNFYHTAECCPFAASELLDSVAAKKYKCCVFRLFRNLNQSVAEIISEISLTVFLTGTLLNTKEVILISSYLCSTYLVGRLPFQTFFCVERYLAVVHPLVYLKYTKDTKCKVTLVGQIWLIILMFGWYLVDSYPNIPIRLSMGMYLAMLVVCTSCSVMILWVLQRSKPGDRQKEGAYQLKKKAFVAITVILITLVFGYGTFSSVIILRDQLPYHTYCLVLGLSWWTLLPSSAVQPYLYLSKIDKLPCIRNV